MKNYLEFVWQSAIHPNNFIDLLPVIQLVLAVICWVYMGTYVYLRLKEKYGKK